MRLSLLCLLSLALTASVCLAEQKPVLTVNVHGDVVEYDQERGTLAVSGKVTVTAQTDRPGAPTMSLAAEQVEGDLQAGKIVASSGVRLLSQQFALRGERVDLDFRNDQFVIDHGGMEVSSMSPASPGHLMRGFFFGDKLGVDGHVVYVIHGRVTTCDRAHPHYSIRAGKTLYDTKTREFTITHGEIQIYGLRLKIPGRIRPRLGRGSDDKGVGIPWPGYSSYDGLYFPLVQDFTKPDSEWETAVTVRLGTQLKLPGVAQAQRETPDSLLRLRMTRREDVLWDYDHRSRVSRALDVFYRHELLEKASGLPRLGLEVFGGQAHEHTLQDPAVEAWHGGVALEYTPRPWQQQQRRGLWWSGRASQTFYDTGDDLRDISVTLGTGWRFGDRIGASLAGTHHFTNGQSPFNFDDVYVEDELDATLELQLAKKWALAGEMKWDADRQEARDYELRLSHRMHCLTWVLKYHHGAEMVSLGAELNGLTGNTEPPHTKPLVGAEEVPPLPQMVPPQAEDASPFQIVR